MLAALVALIVLLYTFQSLFSKLFSMNYAGSDNSQSTAVFSICFGGFIGLATLVVNGFAFAPTWMTVGWGLLNAVMLWLYNTSLIKAGNLGSYAFAMISNLFGAIILPLLVGVFFLGESLTVLQGVAIALMLVSFIVMNVRSISLKGASGTYYFWCAALFVANGLYATIMNVQQELSAGMQNTEMLAISYIGSALVVIVVQLVRGQIRPLVNGFRMGKKSALFTLACCIVATVASNMLLYLLGFMDSSVLYTIENGGVLVLSAIFSCILFKEKLRWEQILGILIATASIVMLSVG